MAKESKKKKGDPEKRRRNLDSLLFLLKKGRKKSFESEAGEKARSVEKSEGLPTRRRKGGKVEFSTAISGEKHDLGGGEHALVGWRKIWNS